MFLLVANGKAECLIKLSYQFFLPIHCVANQNNYKTQRHGKDSKKSEKITLFWGYFSILKQFDSKHSSVIDSTFGIRCKQYGYPDGMCCIYNVYKTSVADDTHTVKGCFLMR